MNTSATIRPGSLRAWIIACRPRTLPLGIAPVLVGGALAVSLSGPFNGWAWGAAALSAVLLQIASNLANDAFDFEKGVDDEHRVGPLRAAASGLLSPRALKQATLLALSAAAVLGAYLVYLGGWPILALGVAAIVCAVAYTAGPIPLGYVGLGDVFVLLFFGPGAVLGTQWVCAASVSWQSLLLSLGPGLLSANVLAVNNLRDEDIDRTKGKKTLPVRLGRSGALFLFALSCAAAFAIPTFLAISSGRCGLLLPLLAAPFALRIAMPVFRSKDGPTLNRALARTALLTLIYCILLAIGTVW